MENSRGNRNQTYLNIAWALTLVLVIWAIVVGNTDVPSWTVAIPAVVTGFWWAFGRGVVGGEVPEGRNRERNRGR
ncbi:hypothetical protein ASD62_12415 [Phycicoccus sp. Root563]|uniref:hypothetical protein n=1 Tax=unclassified Phycicoccus TaxID=2637926 RepID=UPI0007037F91|nr:MULTISPECIES: hypothetical protein [unclassified Phycicoccus]KQU68083.1 hypothetical protein ASC58_10875 [Phycicoccus sp. Root101]KQZ89981.1 hypothetical protein ASD62_12415 [Phycicoccus sp. Root563]